ncbi:MAG TPA: glycosyltransferase, partial [Candidatus Limnocylindrales bacterium]
LVEDLIGRYPNVRLCRGEKRGLGAAYLRGMSYAVDEMGADVLFELDADLQHDPAKIPEFLARIDEGYDVVVGTRYSGGGSIPVSWPLRRKLLSLVGNLVARAILLKFSLHDWTGGYRALRRAVFMRERRELTAYSGFTFQIALLNKAVRDGFRVAEVPFAFVDRHAGFSKIPSLAYMAGALRYIVGASIEEHLAGTFRRFLVVGGIGFVLQALILRLLVESVRVDPTVANLGAATAAVFSNFNFNNVWTFGSDRIRGIGPYLHKLLSFYATSAVGVLVLQTGTIFVGDAVLGRPVYFASFVAGTALLLAYNFSMYRLVIWPRASA